MRCIPPAVQTSVNAAADAGLALAISGQSALSAMSTMASQPVTVREDRENGMRGLDHKPVLRNVVTR